MALAQPFLVSAYKLPLAIMVNFPGRNGRRRRVLNEEVLAASGSRPRLRIAEATAGHQPMRYSEAAGVEHHPQITDFVPRRYRTIALLFAAGLASTTALAGLHYAAPSLAAAIGVAGLPPFDLASPGNLADWAGSVVLLLASATSLLVYSIRRHRIDDYRGRYRIWLAAGAACLLLSVTSVAGLHHVLAYTLSHVTGWSALRAGAVWWLAVAGLPLAWIAFRTLRDVIECRLAATLWIAALSCYVAAGASYLGFVPSVEPRIDSMLDAVLALLGHWLLLSAVVAYARYVVLDAQGLIPLRTPASRSEKKSPIQKEKREVTAASRSVGESQQSISPARRAESTSSATDWVDGSRPVRERYQDDSEDDSASGSRKLSKADRKRLRKLKAQNRAA